MNEKTSVSVEKIYIVENFFRTECQSTKNQKSTDGKTALPFTLPNCQPDKTGTFQKSIDDKLDPITPPQEKI